MHNRISGSSTRAIQADELSQSVNSDSFTEALANLALRRKLPPGELPDKMGCCPSKPQASDPNNPSTSSPESTSLFQYRTAELPQANVSGICVGLAAEWLSNLHNSPGSRMTALLPGSDGHGSAAGWQQQYQKRRREARSEGAGSSQANLDAKTSTLQAAGLQPSNKEKVYAFDEPTSFSRMLGKVTSDGSKYLLSLRFNEGDRHSVATSTLDGRTTLFDPNYGEFTVQSEQMGSLFESLANRYRNPNGLHLSTIIAQKMH
ncbi:YopT-type cysteine protease domain-containing protein [Mesorhizobium tamadayense]|uniref:YopT-type cysteine protease domain-containing protein n=2 Tax=Mesorhizobium tamadayense TaxID=425306 RepID=A0A3P3F0T7_9HYPH|nr:YopT-type cysteine protease domain-containing protein [Mesorhizobium tamadayense]